MEIATYRFWQLVGFLVCVVYFAHNYFPSASHILRYQNFYSVLADTNNLPFSLWFLYFTRRSLETLFLHQFSTKATGPIELYDHFLNYTYIWGFTGIISVQAAKSREIHYSALVCILFALLNLASLWVHNQLAKMRRSHIGPSHARYLVSAKGSGIFRVIQCPHYLIEIGIWSCYMLLCPSVEVLIYLCVVIGILGFRSYQKRKFFLKEYPALFSGNRRLARSAVIVPFLF